MNYVGEVLHDENAHGTSAAVADDVGGERNELRAKKVSDEPATSAAMQDRTKRQEYLQMLVKNGQKKAKKASKISSTIGAIADTILEAKPYVAIILQAPQAAPAAIPWAGACLVLDVSSYLLVTWSHVS